MGKLVYTAICSLDGYIEDETGDFSWAAPDTEVHSFINSRESEAGTMLLGRKTYETLQVWETMDTDGHDPAFEEYKQVWLASDKVVYSRSLTEVGTVRTRVETEFDPDAVRAMKAGGDVSIGGPNLGAEAFHAGLIDEVRIYLSPAIVGGGKPALPEGVRVDLELLEERRFEAGVVYLSYAVRG